MNFSKEVFKEYFVNKIDVETLIEKLEMNGRNFFQQMYEGFEKELLRKDAEMVEYLIYALFLWEERKMGNEKETLDYFVDVLTGLLLCDWHMQHENIVTLLQKISSANSIEALYQAIYLVLPYLEWDENYSFQVKCVRAIGSIGGEKAIQKLEILSGEDNLVIQRISKKKLLQLKEGMN